SPAASVVDGVCRLIANHHDLAIFESAPEVRALSSASITRLRRSYDPVRLPPWPPPFATLRPLPSPLTGLPRLPEPRGCACRLLPHACSLPQMTGGSASALELSRPARASLCYGPPDCSTAQGRLGRRAPTQPVTRPCRLPASGPIDNYPGETLPH